MSGPIEIKYSVYQVSKTRWTWEVFDAEWKTIKTCPGYYRSQEVARAECLEWLRMKYPNSKLESEGFPDTVAQAGCVG